MSKEEFKIEVSEKVLSDLKMRLENTRFPDQVEDASWDYGTNLDYMRGLVNFWKNDFDWQAQVL